MSDYFARIIGRAAGGNLAPPLVRALPALYVPRDQSEALVAVESERIAPRPAPIAQSLIPAPLRDPQTTETAPKAKPGTMPTRATAEAPLHQPHVPASPTHTPPEQTPSIERTKPESTAKAAVPGAVRQSKPVAVREKTMAHPDPVPAAKTITTETSHAFLRADPQPAPNNASFAHSPNTAAPELPTVTIGRIDISVAAPEPPPRTAPDTRTRGFQSYARLRRGLVR